MTVPPDEHQPSGRFPDAEVASKRFEGAGRRDGGRSRVRRGGDLQLTADRDELLAEVELTSWIPGPAGLASLDLGDGSIMLLADYATPGQLASVIYSVDSPAVPALLDALTGGNGRELAQSIDQVANKAQIVWPSTNTAPSNSPFRGNTLSSTTVRAL